MRERALSSIGVVLFGLVPAILGGPIFMIVFVAITLVSFTELLSMLQVTQSPVIRSGYLLIAACGVIPLVWRGEQRTPLMITIIALVPLVSAIFVGHRGAVEHWMLASAAVMYLGVPTFSAIDIRETTGQSSGWLASIASWGPLSRDDSGRGLGWLLLAILVTWLADTGAYLVGKSIGRRKLIPHVSPNKTVEGAAGGLAAALVTSILCSWVFGLDLNLALAGLVGLGLGAIGMLGDLAESMIKRHAGVKDSGSLIPGHGGILDRIDGMLFAILATWLVASFFS